MSFLFATIAIQKPVFLPPDFIHLQMVERFDRPSLSRNQTEAQDAENSGKNRDSTLLPNNKDRPILMTLIPGRNTYINAVFVKVTYLIIIVHNIFTHLQC